MSEVDEPPASSSSSSSLFLVNTAVVDCDRSPSLTAGPCRRGPSRSAGVEENGGEEKDGNKKTNLTLIVGTKIMLSRLRKQAVKDKGAEGSPPTTERGKRNRDSDEEDERDAASTTMPPSSPASALHPSSCSSSPATAAAVVQPRIWKGGRYTGGWNADDGGYPEGKGRLVRPNGDVIDADWSAQGIIFTGVHFHKVSGTRTTGSGKMLRRFRRLKFFGRLVIVYGPKFQRKEYRGTTSICDWDGAPVGSKKFIKPDGTVIHQTVQCVACNSRDSTVLLPNCGHCCLCSSCYGKMLEISYREGRLLNCPTCRAPVF